MSTRLVALGAAVITAATLTACSSSGGGDAAPSADVLPGIVLKAADLPSSWKASAHDASDDASDSSDQAALRSCVGGDLKDTSGDSVKKVHSQDFADGEISASSTAELFKSADSIKADEKLFSQPKSEQCYETLIKKAFAKSAGSDATIGAVSVDISTGSNGGPKNVVAVVTAKVALTVEGKKTTLYSDATFITGNHIEAEVDLTGFGARVSDSVRSKAVAAVAKRADAA